MSMTRDEGRPGWLLAAAGMEEDDGRPAPEDSPEPLSEVEIEIIAGNLGDYADCLFEQAGWCGDKDIEQELRENARESIALADKFTASYRAFIRSLAAIKLELGRLGAEQSEDERLESLNQIAKAIARAEGK